MTNPLAAMLAKQKAQRENQNGAATTGGSNGDSSGNPSSVADRAPAAPAPAAASGAKLGFLAKKPAAPAPVPKPGTESDEVEDGVMTLDMLGNTEDLGTRSTSDSPMVDKYSGMFDDEIAATAPTRELPEDLNAQQQAFVQQVDSIYEIIHDPELFGQQVRIIMQEMQENPDYIKLMADADFNTMIRGLRQSMGLARIKKVEKSTRAKGGSAKGRTSKSVTDTMMSELDNIDFS